MMYKFDDGEHCNLIPGEVLGGFVPEIGQIIVWESEPEDEDELAKGRYRISKVEWFIGMKTSVTIHLDPIVTLHSPA